MSYALMCVCELSSKAGSRKGQNRPVEYGLAGVRGCRAYWLSLEILVRFVGVLHSKCSVAESQYLMSQHVSTAYSSRKQGLPPTSLDRFACCKKSRQSCVSCLRFHCIEKLDNRHFPDFSNKRLSDSPRSPHSMATDPTCLLLPKSQLWPSASAAPRLRCLAKHLGTLAKTYVPNYNRMTENQESTHWV